MTIEFTDDKIFHAIWYVYPNHHLDLHSQIDLMGAVWQEDPAGPYIYRWRWRYYHEESAWGDKDEKRWWDAEALPSVTYSEMCLPMDAQCMLHVMRHHPTNRYPPGPLRDLQACVLRMMQMEKEYAERGEDMPDEVVESFGRQTAVYVQRINVRWFVTKCPHISFLPMHGLTGIGAAEILMKQDWAQGKTGKVLPGETRSQALQRTLKEWREEEKK